MCVLTAQIYLPPELDLLSEGDLVCYVRYDITTSDLETKKLKTLLFPAVKIIVDVPGWGCGGSQQDCLGLGHVRSRAQVSQAGSFLP